MKLSLTQVEYFRNGIVDCFSIEELKTLCIDLDILYEDIEGKTRTGKAGELIKYCERRGKTKDLIDYCSKKRPHYDWPEVFDTQQVKLSRNKVRENREAERSLSSPTLKDVPNTDKEDSKNQQRLAKKREVLSLVDEPDKSQNIAQQIVVEEFREHCSELRRYLEAEDWKAADQETVKIILQIAKRDKDGWISSKDIEQFPCLALQIIDDLWKMYSNGRFGFSVQRKIWTSIGGQPGMFDARSFRKFSDRVGWRKNNNWLKTYDDFTFTTDAPEGHLPSLRLLSPQDGTRQWASWRGKFENFLSRVDVCLSGY